MKNEKVCIVCPRGCMLNYETTGGDLKISNNFCKRGPIYLEQELKEPKRMLTTTIKVNGGNQLVVPVYSKEYVLKDDVHKIISKLKEIKLDAPIKCNDILIKEIDGIEVEILASKNILKV